MRNPSAQGRTDANHSEVTGWYEELFCSVVDLHAVGGGVPDLLIGCAGRSELVEVKTEHGQLEPAQVTFIRDWRGAKVVIVRTQADVINHVMNIRERVTRGKGHAAG
jgi:hypothetical protein